jgi:hypothetical protein
MNRESSEYMYPYKEKTSPIVFPRSMPYRSGHLFDILSITADVGNLKDVLRH